MTLHKFQCQMSHIALTRYKDGSVLFNRIYQDTTASDPIKVLWIMDITEQRLYMNDHKVEYNEYGIMGHVTWSLDNLSSTAFATACWRTGYSFWQTSTHCLVPCREWKPLLSFHFSLRNFELIGKIQVQISGYLRTIW